MASNSFAPGALLTSYIDDTLDMLNSDDILNYFQDKDLDESLLDKLSVSLSFINLVMDDAENKHFSNKYKQVRRWLHKVRDAVHDVDDILDEIQTEASQSKLLPVAEVQTTTSSSSSVSSFDEEVQSRLKKVVDNLESLASQKDSLGLEKINGSDVKYVFQRCETTSLVDETSIYGRNDDKNAIIDLLLSNNGNATGGNNLTVISIVGMGGMGKTTLAQLVFNDRSMDDEFQLKAWVCVSEDFDVIKVTRTILQALNLPTSGLEDLNTLHVKLKEKLAGKKYLLVLDDVWDEKNNKWEALQAPLLYGARGSKILVTTRSKKVASIMRCAHVHELKQLSEERSWLLFARHALCPANSTSNFEEIGRKIIKKCNGLPLALKAIGSLLHDNSNYEEWNRISTSHMWDISDTGCDIIPALILSYQFLPSLLKRCFAYCSLIPKDYEFGKGSLTELWMAENFLQVHQLNKGMNELGDQFFDDLLSRSFFQRSTHKKKWFDPREFFVMHDLVNDLATYVSREFCLKLEEEQTKNISKMTRHISKQKGSLQFEATCKANKLRTVISFSSLVDISCKKVDDFLCKFKCLRALSLHFKGDNLPGSIGNLKHLRYLDLSFSRFLKKLPDSTCLLYNLQTLKLRDCSSLEELPSNMHKLVNLRHLDFEGTKVRKLPNKIGNLKKLEVLNSFYVGKCGEVNINQLGEMLRLRGRLSIEELQNVTDPKDAVVANLKNKILLEELSLRWDSGSEDVKRDGYEIEEDVLEKLQPPANLRELNIFNYDGTKFPRWLGDMSINNNIVSLWLYECKYCVSLPPLGMLPSLKKLKISGLKGIKRIGAEFYGNNNNNNNNNNKEMDSHPHNSSSSTVFVAAPAPFRSLQLLGFYYMEAWEEWDCENASTSSHAFPCLKGLYLFRCSRLKTKLPQHLPSLFYLYIEECPQLVATYKKELPGSSYTCLETLKIWGLEIQILQVYPYFNSLRRLELVESFNTDEAFPLYLFPKLQQLRLVDCRNLERLDVGSGGTGTGGVTSHHHLTRLVIQRCPEFVAIPQTLFFPSLTELELWDCPKLASIPLFTLFPSLTELKLQECPEAEWPEDVEGGGGFPSTLKTLRIYNCPKLLASQNKWDLHALISLTQLTIRNEDYNHVDCEEWLSLPPNLKTLNGKYVGTSS